MDEKELLKLVLEIQVYVSQEAETECWECNCAENELDMINSKIKKQNKE